MSAPDDLRGFDELDDDLRQTLDRIETQLESVFDGTVDLDPDGFQAELDQKVRELNGLTRSLDASMRAEQSELLLDTLAASVVERAVAEIPKPLVLSNDWQPVPPVRTSAPHAQSLVRRVVELMMRLAEPGEQLHFATDASGSDVRFHCDLLAREADRIESVTGELEQRREVLSEFAEELGARYRIEATAGCVRALTVFVVPVPSH